MTNIAASTLGGAIFALAAVSIVARFVGVPLPIALYVTALVLGSGGGMIFAIHVSFPKFMPLGRVLGRKDRDAPRSGGRGDA